MEDNYSHIGATRASTSVNTLTYWCHKGTDLSSHIGATRAPTSVQDELRFMTDGFADWADCRERRRQNFFRSVLLIVSVVACVGSAVFFMPERTDTYVSGNLQCCTDDACSRVNVMMASL